MNICPMLASPERNSPRKEETPLHPCNALEDLQQRSGAFHLLFLRNKVPQEVRSHRRKIYRGLKLGGGEGQEE
jgi:hypothetical protein